VAVDLVGEVPAANGELLIISGLLFRVEFNPK